MFKGLRIAVLAACLPGMAMADPAFSPAQRAEIVQILREALKTDPSILRDAVEAMQADEQNHTAEESRKAVLANKAALFNKATDPQAGNLSGDVTMVEFYDPRCPYCRRVLPEIASLLERDHKLRWVYKDIPVLGPDSTLEAQAIVAAKQQNAYLKMQAALMSDPSKPSEDGIKATADRLGLDGARLLRDMKSDAVTSAIKENLALARSMKVNGTPTFVVGSTVIPGAASIEQLEEVIADSRKNPG